MKITILEGVRKMKTAAIYARASTKGPESETIIAKQVAMLLKFAETHGYQVPSACQFADSGVSPTFTLTAPGLERLREAARSGAFKLLLVPNRDRLTRSVKFYLSLREEFDSSGVEVLFLDGSESSLAAWPEEIADVLANRAKR